MRAGSDYKIGGNACVRRERDPAEEGGVEGILVIKASASARRSSGRRDFCAGRGLRASREDGTGLGKTRKIGINKSVHYAGRRACAGIRERERDPPRRVARREARPKNDENV